jgi:hypothetical protein
MKTLNMQMAGEIDRRHFLGLAAATVIAAYGTSGSAQAEPAKRNVSAVNTDSPQQIAPFRNLRQIEAGVLNVAYAEDGPADG